MVENRGKSKFNFNKVRGTQEHIERIEKGREEVGGEKRQVERSCPSTSRVDLVNKNQPDEREGGTQEDHSIIKNVAKRTYTEFPILLLKLFL